MLHTEKVLYHKGFVLTPLQHQNLNQGHLLKDSNAHSKDPAQLKSSIPWKGYYCCQETEMPAQPTC